MPLFAQQAHVNYLAVLCVIPILAVLTITVPRIDTHFHWINQWLGFLEIGLALVLGDGGWLTD